MMGAARTGVLWGWVLAGLAVLAVLGSTPPALAQTAADPTPQPASSAPRSAPSSPLPEDQGSHRRSSGPGIGICIVLGPIRVEIALGARCDARKSPPPPLPPAPPTPPAPPAPLAPPAPAPTSTVTSSRPGQPSPVPPSLQGAPRLRAPEPTRSTSKIPSPVSSPTPAHRVRVLEPAPHRRRRNPLGTVLFLVILSIAIAVGMSLAFAR